MKRLAMLLVVLAACGPHTKAGWTVINATPEQEVQAQDLVTAARVATGAELRGGFIILVTTPYGLDGGCPLPPGYTHISGCAIGDQLSVLIAPPLLGPDLTTTALPHELGHLACATDDEAQANACGARIVQEYQREHP